MNVNSRNPGLLAVTAGVGLAVLFAALGVAGVGLNLQQGLGLATASLVVASLVYIFFSRANAVARTGYASLLMIIATTLLISLLTVNQQQQQASASTQLYQTRLQTAAARYATYCASCHGLLGQGINGPALNNNPDISKLTDDDLTRIISGGIADPNNPKALLMPAWLQAYGGALTEQDISDLVAFIRSSDPAYRKTNSLPSTNGFGYVFGSLTTATQIAEYHQEQQSGSRPPLTQFTDMTGKSQVTIPIENSTTLTPGANWSFAPRYIIVSVGTTITWDNMSGAPHTVVPKKAGAFPASSVLSAGTGTYFNTFTTAGDYPYFCSIHPAMTAWIIVK